MNGQQLIERERQRQKEVEGYTTQHDDDHDYGELQSAAICYEENAHKKLTDKLSAPAQWPRARTGISVKTYSCIDGSFYPSKAEGKGVLVFGH